MSKCRSCLTTIQWRTTAKGRRTPVNEDGSPHWATCPDADKFKFKQSTKEREDKMLSKNPEEMINSNCPRCKKETIISRSLEKHPTYCEECRKLDNNNMDGMGFRSRQREIDQMRSEDPEFDLMMEGEYY